MYIRMYVLVICMCGGYRYILYVHLYGLHAHLMGSDVNGNL